MPLFKLKRFWAIVIVLVCYAALSSCSSTSIILKTAPNRPADKTALPEISAANLAEWEEQKPNIISALQRDIYGSFPAPAEIISLEKTPLNSNVYEGQGRAENWRLRLEITREDGIISQGEFNMAVLLPKSDGPVPIISMQTFCPTHATLPGLDISANGGTMCEGEGFGARLMLYVFGRYIASPPIEDILAHGYGIAAMYPSEIIPDNRIAGRAAMTALFGPSALGAQHNASVIGGWAYIWAAAAKALAQDAGIDGACIATFGHSRYGKSALLTAAWSDDIAAVISHQSGTGGASLNRGKKGESVTQIMESYPHWFAPAYAKYDGETALEVEQHHLLGLIAPTPVLLGNARRDVWSDPEGGFLAAQGADRVYELYGKEGLTVTRLNEFDPQAELSYWIRGGTHGIVKEDWPAFLDFLDAHFQ